MSNSVRVAMWKSARLRAGFLCAAVLATLGFPASSLAQSSLTQTGYLLDSELERVKETMKRGCRYANEVFPGFARGFSFDQEAAPLSRTEYNRIHNEWSKLPICPTTNVAVQPFFGVNIGGAFQSTNF